MPFTLQATDGEARAGLFETDHGSIETPVFMPVGTRGSVKGVSPRILQRDVGAQIVLGNTYHLYMRPGMEVIEEAGGLHPFMGWQQPLLTDSGGFQVFSLADLRDISEEGVRFQSHLDGSEHLFTPESTVDVQRQIGADIIMALDECPPADVSRSYAEASNARTLRWAARCRERFAETEPLYGHRQWLFPIVQGVLYPELRRDSTRQLVNMDFPGYGIGGLSVGEPASQMYEMVEVVIPLLPKRKPRYLMGVGAPANLLENVARGVDMFDCVMPTRNGRNGMLFTTQGTINITNSKWKKDYSSLDPVLDNYASRNFTKAYVRHLMKRNEILGLQLASQQNLAFYHWLMQRARTTIQKGRFMSWKREIQPRITRRL